MQTKIPSAHRSALALAISAALALCGIGYYENSHGQIFVAQSDLPCKAATPGTAV